MYSRRHEQFGRLKSIVRLVPFSRVTCDRRKQRTGWAWGGQMGEGAVRRARAQGTPSTRTLDDGANATPMAPITHAEVTKYLKMPGVLQVGSGGARSDSPARPGWRRGRRGRRASPSIAPPGSCSPSTPTKTPPSRSSQPMRLRAGKRVGSTSGHPWASGRARRLCPSDR